MNNKYNKRYAKLLLENVRHGASANKYVQQCRDKT